MRPISQISRCELPDERTRRVRTPRTTRGNSRRRACVVDCEHEARAPGSVKFRTGGDSPRTPPPRGGADPVEFRDRRLKSGWEEARVADRSPRPRRLDSRRASPESVSRDGGPDDRRSVDVRRRDAPRARARRAAGPSPAATRRSAACCSTPTAPIVAEGWHRGAGTPHAEVDALVAQLAGRARADRRRHPRALQPHRPHRPVQRGAHRGRRRRASSTRSPTRATSRRAARERLRDAGVEVIAGVLADEAERRSCTSG